MRIVLFRFAKRLFNQPALGKMKLLTERWI